MNSVQRSLDLLRALRVGISHAQLHVEDVGKLPAHRKALEAGDGHP
ncbi:MAG: hypothetical protein JXB85_10480 [Anaerolineales bacterium]|nr:hypothetical protein [Anaerolineales bacterium]